MSTQRDQGCQSPGTFKGTAQACSCNCSVLWVNCFYQFPELLLFFWCCIPGTGVSSGFLTASQSLSLEFFLFWSLLGLGLDLDDLKWPFIGDSGILDSGCSPIFKQTRSKAFVTLNSNSCLPSGARFGCICVCLMALGEGWVYICEGEEGLADFFHMFIYSHITILIISPAQILPAIILTYISGDPLLCVFSCVFLGDFYNVHHL